MVEDDGKPLVLNDEEERDISDREGKTQELRSEQAEARYGSEGIFLSILKRIKKRGSSYYHLNC